MLGAVKENLRNLISYFDVIKYMIKRDLKITYGRYILSYGWTLLEPLLFTLVFMLFSLCFEEILMKTFQSTS